MKKKNKKKILRASSEIQMKATGKCKTSAEEDLEQEDPDNSEEIINANSRRGVREDNK